MELNVEKKLLPIFDLVSFALNHELLELARVGLVYLVTRCLAIDTCADITNFVREIN